MVPIRYRTPNELKAFVKQDAKTTKAFVQKLKKKDSKLVDSLFHQLHEQAFERFNCLECANCCSSISPIVTDKDIVRLAKALRMKPSALVTEYLNLDEEGDYVFKQTPCPFLGADNYCAVYEDRPKACREYPHTDRNKMQQILTLTARNCEVCPVVYEIVEEMKRKDQLR